MLQRLEALCRCCLKIPWLSEPATYVISGPEPNKRYQALSGFVGPMRSCLVCIPVNHVYKCESSVSRPQRRQFSSLFSVDSRKNLQCGYSSRCVVAQTTGHRWMPVPCLWNSFADNSTIVLGWELPISAIRSSSYVGALEEMSHKQCFRPGHNKEKRLMLT